MYSRKKLALGIALGLLCVSAMVVAADGAGGRATGGNGIPDAFPLPGPIMFPNPPTPSVLPQVVTNPNIQQTAPGQPPGSVNFVSPIPQNIDTGQPMYSTSIPDNGTIGRVGQNSLGTFNLGCGVLIGAQQVLMVAQGITDVNNGQVLNPSIGTDLRFEINAVTYTGIAVAINPTWTGSVNPPIPAEMHFDLAILILTQKVPINPSPMNVAAAPGTVFTGGYGYLSAPGGCGPYVLGLLPGGTTAQGIIQVGNRTIPPIGGITPTFIKPVNGAQLPTSVPVNVQTVDTTPYGYPQVPNVNPPLGGVPGGFPFYGDTGTGLFEPDSNGFNNLIGIATFCPAPFPCGVVPFFVRVDAASPAQPWIKSFINGSNNLPPPPPSADLVITSVALPPGPPVVNQPYSFSVTIANLGSINATSFYVAAFLNKTTPALSSVDNAALQQIVNGLVVGASVTVNLTVTYTTPGPFTLCIQADPDHNLTEVNTLNNTAFFKVDVLALGVNLRALAIIKSETILGINPVFTIQIDNHGLQAAGAFRVACYNNLIDSPLSIVPGDPSAPVPDEVPTVAGLAPGASTLVTVTLPVQSSPHSGHFWAFVNDNQAVAEDIFPKDNLIDSTWGINTGAPTLTSPASTPNSVVQVGSPVTFTVGVTDAAGNTISYLWDFGDGQTAVSGSTVNHIYSAPGQYTVTVTFSNGAFNSGTSSIQFTALVFQNLGSFSFGAKHGRLTIKIPQPTTVFAKKKGDRQSGKLSSGAAGGKSPRVKVSSNFKGGALTLSGLGTADVGTHTIFVSYTTKGGLNALIPYTYTLTQ